MMQIGPELAAVQLAASIAFADDAAGASAISLYATTQPAVGGAPGASPLAVVVLEKPCATLGPGTITLHALDPAGTLVLTNGVPLWARWERSDGLLVADGSVTKPGGDGDFVVSGGTVAPGDASPTLYAGGLVLLGVVTLT